MALPDPKPGLVIHYGFLWRHEQERGAELARYARPCALVAAVRRDAAGEIEVLVTPFTHLEPEPGRTVLELPSAIQAELGLPKRTWAICDEVNVFTWPGFDLERNAQGEFAWGVLPTGFLTRLRAAVLGAVQAKGAKPLPR